MHDPVRTTLPRDAYRPRFATAWVSAGLLLLLVGAGGYFLAGPHLSSSTNLRDLEPVMPARGGGLRNLFAPQQPTPPRADGIRKRSQNSYQARAGEFTVVADKSRDGKWSLRFTGDQVILSPEEDASFTARWRLTHDGAFAKSLNLTNDQLKALGEIPGKGGLIIDQADQDRMRDLFDKYVAAAAPKANEEAAIVVALAEICRKSIPQTRQSLLDRIAKINSILTPDQLAKFKPGAK